MDNNNNKKPTIRTMRETDMKVHMEGNVVMSIKATVDVDVDMDMEVTVVMMETMIVAVKCLV